LFKYWTITKTTHCTKTLLTQQLFSIVYNKYLNKKKLKIRERVKSKNEIKDEYAMSLNNKYLTKKNESKSFWACAFIEIHYNDY
jgi:hypothetical protein